MRHTRETILARVNEVFQDDSKIAFIVYYNPDGANSPTVRDMRKGQPCTIEKVDKLDTKKSFFQVKLENGDIRYNRVSGVFTITVRSK